MVANGGSTLFGFLYHDNFHNELMRNERKFFFSSIARLHKTETFKLVFHHEHFCKRGPKRMRESRLYSPRWLLYLNACSFYFFLCFWILKRKGAWRFTVLTFFPSGISVIVILMCGIAVSSSPSVCGFLSFWLTVFGKRSFMVLRYRSFVFLCLMQVNIWKTLL